MTLTDEQKKELKLQIEREIYNRSYYEFFKKACTVLEPATDWSFNWHFEYLCDIMQEEGERISKGEKKDKDLIINIPFRSGKSMLFTIVFPVWLWTIFPEAKVLSLSYSADLSTSHSYKSKILMMSEWFKELYPEIEFQADMNSKSHFANNSGGERIAFGFGGSVTGSGGDIILCDDPNHIKQTSNLNLKNDQRSYNEIIYSRLNNPSTGLRVIIQQRLAKDDLSGYLLSATPDKYRHICIPAKLASHIEPKILQSKYVNNLFWRDRFTNEELNNYLTTLGSKQFANQLQQLATPDEGVILKREWFGIEDYNPLVHGKIIWDLYIDPAYTKDKSNDPTGIVIASAMNGILYVYKAFQFWLEFPELLRKISELNNLYCSKSSKIYVEPKASGKSIVQSLRNETLLNVIEIKTRVNGKVVQTESKVTRANACSPIVESRRVVLIRDSWNEGFIEECITFPFGTHDDQLDCMMFAIEEKLSKNNREINYKSY